MSIKVTPALLAAHAGHPLADACEQQRIAIGLALAAMATKDLELEARDKVIRDMAREGLRLRRELREARAQLQSGGRIRRHG